LILLCPAIGIAESLPNLVFIQGVRPMSMGGAFTAVADDENLLFFNPAGLQKIENSRLTISGFSASFNIDTIQMMYKIPSSYWDAEKWQSISQKRINTLQNYDSLIRVSNPLLQFTYIRPNFAVSLLNSDVSVHLDFSHSGEQSVVRLKERGDIIAMVSYSKKIIPGLSLGGTLKWIEQQRIDGKIVADLLSDLGEQTSIFGISLSNDLGVLYKFQDMIPKLPLTLGISAQNILGVGVNRVELRLKNFRTVNTFSRQSPKRLFMFGIAYQPDWKIFSPYFPEALTFAADVGGLDPIIHLGIEVKLLRWLSLRTGLHNGFSAGLGLQTQRLFFDAMYATKLREPFLDKSPINDLAFSLMVRY
jgi:hypothetical protein